MLVSRISGDDEIVERYTSSGGDCIQWSFAETVFNDAWSGKSGP
jgi:hypothetical protein